MGDPIQLKDEGNKHFQSGDIDMAIECYTSALKVCKDRKVLAVIHRNRSACYLKKVSSLMKHQEINITDSILCRIRLFNVSVLLQENYTNAASDASKGRTMNTEMSLVEITESTG